MKSLARVNLSSEAGELSLVISDNGCGFDTGRVAHHAGLGLIGMRERVAELGGTVRAEPRADGGFTVCAELPFRAAP